jgi:hypothetical protein
MALEISRIDQILQQANTVIQHLISQSYHLGCAAVRSGVLTYKATAIFTLTEYPEGVSFHETKSS